MKHLLTLFFIILFSGNSFAVTFQLNKAEPGPGQTATAVKNTCSKKIAKSPGGKEPVIINQKLKKESSAENTTFYGPLSWKPALLF
jgi:hypothetical protein